MEMNSVGWIIRCIVVVCLLGILVGAGAALLWARNHRELLPLVVIGINVVGILLAIIVDAAGRAAMRRWVAEGGGDGD